MPRNKGRTMDSPHVEFLRTRRIEPHLKGLLAVLGDLSCSPWKFDVLWEYWPTLRLRPENFPALAAQMFDTKIDAEMRYAASLFDDVTIYWDVVGRAAFPHPYTRSAYRSAYLSLRPMVFRTEIDAPPPPLSTTEEQYLSRLVLIGSLLSQTQLSEVILVLKETAAGYRARGHTAGATISEQNVKILGYLSTAENTPRGPEAVAQEALKLMMSTEQRQLAYEIVLQWWPLFDDQFWDRFRIIGSDILPGEDSEGSAMRAQMRHVFEQLSPFAELVDQRPGLAAAIIGLSILRKSRSKPLPSSVALLPLNWLDQCRDTAIWLKEQWRGSTGLLFNEIDLIADALARHLQTGQGRLPDGRDALSIGTPIKEEAVDQPSEAPFASSQFDPPEEVFRLNQEGMRCIREGSNEKAVELGTQARELAARHLGVKGPHYAMSLNTIATAKEAQKQYSDAHALFSEASSIFRDALGEHHASYGASVNNLAKLEAEMGHPDVAERLFNTALEIYRIALGERHPYCAATMNNLARLRMDRGDVASAETLYRDALEIRRETLGREHPDYALSLNHLGSCLLKSSNLAGAEPLYRESLAIRTKTLGELHPETIDNLVAAAGINERLGRFETAISFYRRLLKARQATVGDNDDLFLDALKKIGALCTKSGDYKAAAKFLRQATALHAKIHGEHDSEFASALNEQGLLFIQTEKYPLAAETFQRAMQIDRNLTGEESWAYARDLMNLAEVYKCRSEFISAERLFTQANEILSRCPDAGAELLGAGLNNQAELYRAMGKFEEAEPLYRRVIEIWASEFSDKHPNHAGVLNNLALLHRQMGFYNKALECFERALRGYETSIGSDHATYAKTLGNLGMLQVAMGDYETAEKSLTRALEIKRRVCGEGSCEFANSLDNLGSLYGSVGDLRAAERVARQALEIYKTTLGSAHPEVANSLHNMAALYLRSGHIGLAAEYLSRMEPILKEALSSSPNSKWAGTLVLWARIFSDVGNRRAAEPLLRQAIELQERYLGPHHPDLGYTLRELAELAFVAGDVGGAIALMTRASAITDKIIANVFSATTDRQRMAYCATVRAELDLFLSMVCESQASEGDVGFAMDLVLKRKALAAEALAAQRDAVLSGRYPELAAGLNELNAIRAQIAERILAGPGQEGLRAHEDALISWERQREALEATLVRRIPEMDLQFQLNNADRSAIAAALPQGAALVEFILFTPCNVHARISEHEPRFGPDRYLAFVLSDARSGLAHVVDLGEAEVIDTLVSRFRNTVAVPPAQRRPGSSDAGDHLHRAVFSKLIPALNGCRQLLIAPDGDLSRLPFEPLPTDSGGLLIDEYRLSYLSCGRDVIRFKGRSYGGTSVPLVMADPAFNLALDGESTKMKREEELAPPAPPLSRDFDRSLRFWRLKGTREEGQRIADVLGVQPLLGESAQKSVLMQVRSPRVLHLATHGFFLRNEERRMLDEERLSTEELHSIEGLGRSRLCGPGMENPLLRSGLVLAGANVWLRGGVVPADAGNGLVTAEDVSGIDLLDTELAVLSACETGLGEIRTGEGVFGLRRAFALAGAHRLIISLWKVPDNATCELMVEFYRRVLDGIGVFDALREAQIATRQRHADPYYWAAFICQGNPGPLDASDTKSSSIN